MKYSSMTATTASWAMPATMASMSPAFNAPQPARPHGLLAGQALLVGLIAVLFAGCSNDKAAVL